MKKASMWAYSAFCRGMVVKLETIRQTNKPTAARCMQRITGGGLDFISIDPVSPNHIFGIAEEGVFNREFPDWKLWELAKSKRGRVLCLRAYKPDHVIDHGDGQVQFERCAVVRELHLHEHVAAMGDIESEDCDD